MAGFFFVRLKPVTRVDTSGVVKKRGSLRNGLVDVSVAGGELRRTLGSY